MSTFTLFHVVISLVAIAAGFVVLAGLLRGQRLDAWTAIFLVTTIATSVTGSVSAIAAALARGRRHLAGRARDRAFARICVISKAAGGAPTW